METPPKWGERGAESRSALNLDAFASQPQGLQFNVDMGETKCGNEEQRFSVGSSLAPGMRPKHHVATMGMSAILISGRMGSMEYWLNCMR